MARKRLVPPEHPAFATLPVRMITIDKGNVRAAVHISGVLSQRRLPVVCVPGYQRNMSDFSAFADYFQRVGGGKWPVVLVDLPGRGRADDRISTDDYGSPRDAEALAAVLAALGIGSAVILGQGYGGQVAMVLNTMHPLLVAGTVLLDAGPVTDSRGLVRLRNNLKHVESLKGEKALATGFRRMLAGDYPGASEDLLDRLVGHTHFIDKRGRPQPLYDKRLIAALDAFSFDDVLMAQWPMYDALKTAPLMLLRTQLTDQLRRETFDEMTRRRPDATALTIAGQGSPALFDQHEEIEAVAGFIIETSTSLLGKAA